ncbi:MAG: pyrroline-5-carboxylate reductase [Burkholderiaceae bacterium]|jgi:pyrroline-5-carboxylate reductase|nr:pyrroline-5-carboxylate reductase [Burkholderiaceae bacterium]
MTTPSTPTAPALAPATHVAFIGGGNMAGAILGGLIRGGLPTRQIQVVEPLAAAREKLAREHGIAAHEQAGDFLQEAGLIVWAVKPQSFAQAAAPVRPHAGDHAGMRALHLSVMAGIRVAAIAAAIGGARIVRAMPNTPALIGQGMTGLYAAPGVQAADRARAEAVIRATGDALWVADESLLDAVTALSGSGPAYVFYVLEAMQAAGVQLGLAPEQARHLAVATFAGSAALARQADEPLATLRERVTSKGGTTHAALTVLDSAHMQPAFIRALHAAAVRAKELGDEFGA